jgi:hypothetical protein
MARMYHFLSAEWVAAAAEIRSRYADQAPPIGVSVRINLEVTDTPLGDDAVLAHIDTSAGEFVFDLGHLDDADTGVLTDYEVAKALVLGAEQAALMQAFMEGRVRINGDMTRLLVLQASLPQGELAEQVAAELAAITA